MFLPHYRRESFGGFYLAITHDFFSDSYKGDTLEISPYLERYPFSIDIDELEAQYSKHSFISRFTSDTNFLTREILPTRKVGTSLAYKTMLNEGTASHYIETSMRKTLQHGIRLLEEYSPAVSYWSVTRLKVKDFILDKFRVEIKEYYRARGEKISIPGKRWYHHLLGI